jgi:hypothetical protein
MAPGYHHKTKANKRHRSRSASTDEKETQKRKTSTTSAKLRDTRAVTENTSDEHITSRTNGRRKKVRKNTTGSTPHLGNESAASTVTTRYATVTDLPDELKMMVFDYVSTSGFCSAVVLHSQLAFQYCVKADL